MPIQFSCSQCQKKMKAPDGTEGKKARCPACSAITRIPTTAVAAAAVPVAQVARPTPVATKTAAPPPPVDDNPFAAPTTADFSGAPASRDRQAREGAPSWDVRPSIGSFFKTPFEVLTKPTDTFRSMTPEGGLGRPLVYAAIVGVMGGLAVASLLFLLFSAMTVQGGAGGNSPSLLGGGLAILLIPIFYAVVLPIGALIGGGFLHGMLVLVGAKKYSYTATTRCLCYIYFSCWPLAIFMVIPILNLLLILPIIGWVVALYIIGLAEVHESTKGKVAIAVLIPFAFFFVLGIVAAILGEPV